MKIWFSNNSKKVDLSMVGGKGYNLLQLIKWGFDVPPFAVLTPVFLDEYEKNPEVMGEILKQIEDNIGGGDFAVRSSMSAEDGKEHSFAGIMESFLHVSSKGLEQAIVKCSKSLLTERVIRYSAKKKIKEKIRAAVIVQKMVESEISGVAFSRSPKGNSALTYIESSYGLGEGIVSGLVNVDSYWCDRFGKVIACNVQDKKTKIGKKGDGEVHEVAVDSAYVKKPSLSLEQVLDLNEKLLSIEEKLQVPCDIEWAIHDGNIYLLQARPITQKFPDLRYYVDTNLSESYPGKTTPITGSFVERVYTKIFTEAIQKTTMVSTTPKQLVSYFDTLVSYVGGHLYYNLTSYYAVLMALPGGKVNIENWHRMNGGQPDKKLDLSSYYHPGIYTKSKIVISLASLVIFHKPIFDDFYEQANSTLASLNRKLGLCQKSKERASLLLWAVKSVKGFSLTILNDLLIMGSLDLLSKSLKRKGYSQSVLGDIIQTGELVESIKPLQELEELLKLLERDVDSLKIYKEKLEQWDGIDSRAFYQHLFSENQSIWSHKMKDYLTKYGDRSFEELKLESMSFSQDPQGFYNFLKWNLKTKFVGIAVEPKERSQIDVSKMGFFFRKILSFCKKVIATREHSRLIRGKFYGWVRAAFIEFAQSVLQEEKELFADLKLKDFFYLTFDDLERFVGYVDYSQLRESILRRKLMDRSVENYPEFFCHPASTDDEPYFFDDEKINAPQASLCALQGMGASKGIVQGEALVLSSPLQAMEQDRLDDKILVTKNTDPAWIFIMGQCRGLISEKGSLLSHTAIIGRELGIPTVVGVREATLKIINGAQIEIDGTEGTITSL